VELKVNSQVGPGDEYATITEVEPMNGDEKVSITHNKGEVMLVDFWATWCPPCQAPMAHNQKMLEEKGAAWGDKVRIIGLSIDQDKNKLREHVESKKWTSVEHYFRAGSDASAVYSVRGVPHVMLLDKNGTIVFKGHPAGRTLEADIETLLADKPLEGDNVFTGAKKEDGADATDNKDAGIPEGAKDVDAEAINAEIDAFKAVGEELQKDEEMKKHAKSMQRAFCVMVFTQTYMPKAGKTVGKYENYRVLVGPQASLDAVKPMLEDKVKGSFEVVLREQAM